MDEENSAGENRGAKDSDSGQSGDKSTQGESTGSSSFAREYENLRNAAFERLNDLLCGDRSQTATGQPANGSLSNRATATDPKSDPLGLGNDQLTGPESRSNQKTRPDSSTNLGLEFDGVDPFSSDLTHLNYTPIIRVEYHCDTGEVTIQDPIGLIRAYMELGEEYTTEKDMWDKANFIFDAKSLVERVSEGISIGLEKLLDPIETSEKADLNSEMMNDWRAEDGSSFQRGLADWPTFRAERVALSEGGNSFCNMPDFRSPSIDRSFK